MKIFSVGIFRGMFTWPLLLLSAILIFLSCDQFDRDKEKDEDPERNLIILYTNDEHGWMEESGHTDGAAKLMGIWRDEEGYTDEGPYLILSGGDNWTGPAISTWFKGESMVQVMNAMRYDAAAIGNHEFDFKIDGLHERVAEAEFPYLSANIRDENNEIPDFALPWVIREINDIAVGIIGLTTVSTPYTTFPDHVTSLHFDEYALTLENMVPEVREAGAELIIVIGHICEYEMDNLVPTLVDLDVAVIGGGHCNDLVAKIVDDVAVIEGGSHLRSYARVEISFDTEADTIMDIEVGTAMNENGSPDPDVEAVVSMWRELADVELGTVIGYTASGISRYSSEMHNMVTDSWLESFPSADISMTNFGGIRQSIPAGDITKGTIIGVLPFDNNIIELELTGTQLIDCVRNLIVGGMYINEGYYHSDSTEILPDSVYKVLTTDYLYARDDFNFHIYDPDPYYTGMNYHQPTIDFILARETNSGNPLEHYLDPLSRR